METTARGLCLGLAVLVAGAALAAAPAAADIVVIRGSASEVVSTAAGAAGGPPAVLRATPGKVAPSYPVRRPANRRFVAHGFQGSGDNLWTVDSRGRVHACWLTGTGYVNSLKVVCTR
jgi:hypothetical protein